MKAFWDFLYPAVVSLILFLGSKIIGFESMMIVIGANLLVLMIEIKDALELRK